MTSPSDKTPATEAGRLEAAWQAFEVEWTAVVRAGQPDLGLDLMNAMGRHRATIEAEAREQGYEKGKRDAVLVGIRQGRADALREAAERVRALPLAKNAYGGRDYRDAVLAILTEQDHG